MRAFTVGIGNGISPLLIQGVARAGKGDYEFVKDSDNITEKTLYLLHSAITPQLESFTITFSDEASIKFTLPNYLNVGTVIKNEPF